MHLDWNCTKIMRMVIVVCTGIVHKFYSAYFFGVTTHICINIHMGAKKHDTLRDGVIPECVRSDGTAMVAQRAATAVKL